MARTCGLDSTGLAQWSVAGSCKGDNEFPPPSSHEIFLTSDTYSRKHLLPGVIYLFSLLRVEKFRYVIQEAPQNWGK